MFYQERSCARQKNWTRQTLNDAWDATGIGTPWQMVGPDLKLTKASYI